MRLDGQTLRIVRTWYGMSQRKLAERAGVSHSLISYIEKGERSLTYDIEEKIWRALNMDSIAVTSILELHRDILNLPEAC